MRIFPVLRLAIHCPQSGRDSEGAYRPSRRDHTFHLAIGISVEDIVPSGKLRDVAVKVRLRELVENSLMRPLYRGPEALHAVFVCH